MSKFFNDAIDDTENAKAIAIPPFFSENRRAKNQWYHT